MNSLSQGVEPGYLTTLRLATDNLDPGVPLAFFNSAPARRIVPGTSDPSPVSLNIDQP